MLIRNMMRVGLVTWVALATGCAHWSSPPPVSELGTLPRPKLAPDSVVWEVTFIRIPPQQQDFADRFWPEVDEAVLPVELRRHLAANGIRCGLVGVSPPAALQEVLDRQPVVEPGGGTKLVDPACDVVARTNRLRSPSGQAGKIVVRNAPLEKLAALTRHEDGRVSGQSLSQAQFTFAIKSYAQGDSRVRLELTPTIEHGQPKFRFRGENGAWMVDNTSREVQLFEDMKIDATLAPGEAVVITSAGQDRGLGDQFFGEDPVEKLSRVMLVVRLQQTQHDDRFEDQQDIEPIASVLD